jgi:hypothetical protein
MRQLYTPTSLNCIRMDGGTYICNPPSAFDTFGRSYVICDKHPDKYIPVDFSFSSLEHNVLTLQKAAIEALRNCPDCLEIEAVKNTRFPEGAEL